jgi:iron complex transport system substrate-binding protein
MITFRRRRLVAVAVLAAVMALTGCASSSGPSQGAQTESVTVTDPKGHDVPVPSNPQSALGFYPTDTDVLITLGFPLAKSQPSRGEGFTTLPSFFPKEPLQGVTVFPNFPYNYDAVLKARPDFILNGLGFDETIHDRLSKIAPTYTADTFDSQSWLAHFEKTAKDLGRQQQYEKWVNDYADKVASAKKDIIAAGNTHLTVIGFSYRDGAGATGCYTGVLCKVIDDLGLQRDPLSNDNDLTLSAEQLGRLSGVDAVWIGKGQGEAGQKEFDATMATLDAVPAWRSLPFVKNHRIFTYDSELSYGSPSAQMAMLEQVRQDLTANPHIGK